MTQSTSPGKENASSDHPVERGGGSSGKVLIIITLSLFIIVPAVTAVSLWVVEMDLTGTSRPLHWQTRSKWTVLPTSRISLVLGTMASARRDRRYEESPLHITAEEDHLLRQSATLAQQPQDAFKAKTTYKKLATLAKNHPDSFYPSYLLATWHRLHGEQKQFAQRMNQALDRSGAVIIQPVQTSDGQPAVDLAIGRIDIGLDRVVDDNLDQSLVLTYPYLKTDEMGRAYLPILKSIYRVDAIESKHIRQPLPNLPRWFTFPGNAGALPLWQAK